MSEFKGSLEAQLEFFRKDESWNSLNRDGTRRFDKEILWIEKMVKEYADKFHMSPDEMMKKMEEKRDYSWPNYYQESNFSLNRENIIGIFETGKEFVEKFPKGFICPKCGRITKNPEECQDGTPEACDWKAYGLFSGPAGVVITSKGFDVIPVFFPVGWEEENEKIY